MPSLRLVGVEVAGHNPFLVAHLAMMFEIDPDRAASDHDSHMLAGVGEVEVPTFAIDQAWLGRAILLEFEGSGRTTGAGGQHLPP